MRAREIARRRIGNSGLIGRSYSSPREVVGRHGAMQAQEYTQSKWSIGQRARGLTHADVDAAIASGDIVRTHALRPTWHFVAREDLRWVLELTGPRVQQQNAPRYRELRLGENVLTRAVDLLVSALKGGVHLTRAEIAGVLDDAGIDRAGQRLPYILMHCELEAVICSGARNGTRHTYALVDERVPRGRRFERAAALAELIRRYLASHGPATVSDLRWWSSLTATDVRNTLETLGSEVRSDVIDGLTFWSLADEGAALAVKGAQLLHVYDELVVGYTESRFFVDPRLELARAGWRSRAVPGSVVLVDDRIAGHWRWSLAKASGKIEVLLYGERPRRIRALRSAVEELGHFLGRDLDLEVDVL
jgi:hypothetical protein